MRKEFTRKSRLVQKMIFSFKRCVFSLASTTLAENFADSMAAGAVADPGENLTGALHSNFWHSWCGGRG